ncbi:piggyBac transposable element-derived protein 4 [Trichonephila clavipes]|nr:piggyBac transposable element-derived protein 4 [Trichonephila clavipes]
MVEMMLLYIDYILYCKSGGSRSPKQFRMELIEKISSENHRDEFSATPGRPSISPSPFTLISGHFPDVIPTIEKKSDPMRQCTLCSRKRDSRGKPVRKDTRYHCTEYQVKSSSTTYSNLYQERFEWVVGVLACSELNPVVFSPLIKSVLENRFTLRHKIRIDILG